MEAINGEWKERGEGALESREGRPKGSAVGHRDERRAEERRARREVHVDRGRAIRGGGVHGEGCSRCQGSELEEEERGEEAEEEEKGGDKGQ